VRTVAVLPLAILTMLLVSSCGGRSGSYELATIDSAANQCIIAKYHSQEATRLRRKAHDLAGQARIYATVFGSESEWTTGTQLLAQSYLEAAEEQERLAEEHVSAGRARSPSMSGSVVKH